MIIESPHHNLYKVVPALKQWPTLALSQTQLAYSGPLHIKIAYTGLQHINNDLQGLLHAYISFDYHNWFMKPLHIHIYTFMDRSIQKHIYNTINIMLELTVTHLCSYNRQALSHR